MRCRVSTATGLLSLMLSVNQATSTTCMLGRLAGPLSFSHAHSADAWLFSDTTWVTLSLRGRRMGKRSKVGVRASAPGLCVKADD